MKKFASMFLGLCLAIMPTMSVYADTTEVDPSTVVVSHVEYEEIDDVDTLLQMAEMAEQGIMPLSDEEDESRRIEFSCNGDQVIVDQLLSETVYGDGNIVQERSNRAIETRTVESKQDQQNGGNTVLTITSTIYYTYDYAGPYFKLIMGATKIIYNPSGLTASIEQTLAIFSRISGTYDCIPKTAVHTGVGTNVEKYVFFDGNEAGERDKYALGTLYYGLNSVVTLSSGESVTVFHSYEGENEY